MSECLCRRLVALLAATWVLGVGAGIEDASDATVDCLREGLCSSDFCLCSCWVSKPLAVACSMSAMTAWTRPFTSVARSSAWVSSSRDTVRSAPKAATWRATRSSRPRWSSLAVLRWRVWLQFSRAFLTDASVASMSRQWALRDSARCSDSACLFRSSSSSCFCFSSASLILFLRCLAWFLWCS
uniref:Putative secreted protein n=1 Tax=Ixodes ricinus TaxID=34613 RepID=A0A6B0V1S3_IXORI